VTLDVVVQVKTRSVLNLREHWAARARRAKAHRAATILALRRAHPGGADARWALDGDARLVVVLTRYGRRLDDDNLRGALKAVRDGVAEWAGLDDGSDQWRWEYAQDRAGKLGERVSVSVRVE